MAHISKNIEIIKDRIAEAALRTGRDVSAVKLMAVTKTVDDARIIEAVESGITLIGENYIQEAKRKIETMGLSNVEWHMIGHLQSNKSKYAVRLFDMIHSVDRIGLAEELDRRSQAAGRRMHILIEVNLAGEASKSGVPKEKVFDLLEEIARLQNLSVQGLMTMPPWFDDPEDARPFFKGLRELSKRIGERNIPGVEMKELSMGMTDDYHVAVEEGATIVRVGRAIFGERPR